MKNFLFITFLIFSFSSFSHTFFPPDTTIGFLKKTELKIMVTDGKKYYSNDNYRAALVKFREVLSIDKTNAAANYWISECHLELKNYEIALKYATLALEKDPEVSKDLYYVLATSYHRLGNLEMAQKNYTIAKSKMSKSRIKDYRIDENIEECNRGLEMIKNKSDYKITPLGRNINSNQDEYAPVISNLGKTLYFSSRRAENEGGGFSSGDAKYFSDIFVSYWNETTQTWSKSSNNDSLVRRLNTNGFDDVSSISSDGKTIYLSINTEGISSPDIVTQSTDIYYAKLSDKNQWNSPRPIDKKNINSLAFEASPSFTRDGNTMYFTSERLGGKGKSDIWVSRKLNNIWTKPENIGDKINTSNQETTVFVTANEEYLFFSSDGHKGMGGYDVYVSKNIDGEWTVPIHLGHPINGVSDETHFSYYPELNKAYYSKRSTKENGGFGGRDIFEIDLSNFDLNKLFSTL